MISQERDKKGLKTLYYELGESCKKKFGINPTEYKKSICAVLILLIICLFFKCLPELSFSSENNQSASVGDVKIEGSNNNVKIELYPSEEDDGISFQPNKWVDSIGSLAVLRRNQNHIILPIESNSGLLKYLEPIKVNDNFKICFKPLSDNAINFVISIPDVYEIVIGDSDYQTVTLKHSLELDSPLNVPVVEIETGKTRPTFGSKAKKNEEISLNVAQELLLNGDIAVHADVLYWAEGNNKKLPKTFKYQFKPSPRIEDTLFLHVGLIRGSVEGEISAELINPLISE